MEIILCRKTEGTSIRSAVRNRNSKSRTVGWTRIFTGLFTQYHFKTKRPARAATSLTRWQGGVAYTKFYKLKSTVKPGITRT
jgi:hypothetical protein